MFLNIVNVMVNTHLTNGTNMSFFSHLAQYFLNIVDILRNFYYYLHCFGCCCKYNHTSTNILCI